MAFYPATLVPVGDIKIRKCGHAGCSTLATFVVVAGGAKQFFVCSECGKRAIEADQARPGKGWK